MDPHEFNDLKALYTDFFKAAKEAGNMKSTSESAPSEQTEPDASSHLAKRL